jgi:GT2 family glycosyltransferase
VATAVVQVHVEQMPARLRVAGGYSRAYVVVRRNDEPITRFDLPVVNEEVDPTAFARSMFEEARENGYRWLARDYLGPEPLRTTADVTVAICTHERPADIRRALTAVTRLVPGPLEVLVIDNAPRTAETREIVAEFPGARYVCEPQRGLDCARNRALTEARGDIVAFTDDDATPEPSWLGRLVRPFDSRLVWCVTGLTLPAELETDAQEWFERYSSFSRGFRRRLFEGRHHDGFSVGSIGAGANMAIRRSVLTRLEGFDEALDAGTATRSGGDHELFGRILAAGYNIVYEPAAVSWHRHRRTWPELRQTLRGYGTGVFALVTRRLLRDREPAALRHGLRWFCSHHLPTLWRAILRRPNTVPRDLICAEVAGCVAGPAAYARSVRALRRRAVR